MSVFSKAKVKTAIESRSKQNLSHQHITTADFFQLNCAFCREIVPQQSINVDFTTFARLSAMPCPTMGDTTIKHHAFFVPFLSVMPGWNDFISDAVHVSYNGLGSGIISYVPRFDVCDLTLALLPSSSSLSASPYVSLNNVQSGDLITRDGYSGDQGTIRYWNFTRLGRQVVKQLQQLGYKLETDLQQGSFGKHYVSALPLLCLLRIYLDWYFPSQYVGNSDYNIAMNLLRYDSVPSYTFTTGDIQHILGTMVLTCYDADYFVSAFDNPSGPNSGLYSAASIEDSSFPSDLPSIPRSRVYVNSSTQATPAVNSIIPQTNVTQAQPANLTDYVLQSLHRLTDYMKRHQLVGARAAERILARFGVTPTQECKSQLLGNYSTPVNFGSVMSNSDTSGARLGDYAGQGFGWNEQQSGHFEFSAGKDYGMFFVLTSIVPKVGYVQGINRRILHLSRFDFFTPEFDALGCQAISKAELFVKQNNDEGQNEDLNYGWLVDKVFGFTPRYAEYKTQLDMLSGDFMIPSLNQAGDSSDSWHLMRMFNPDSEQDIVHNIGFVSPNYQQYEIGSDFSQYDRIFYTASSNSDHFFIRHQFNISSSFPGKNLFDTYDFDEHNGKELEIEAGGVKVN